MLQLFHRNPHAKLHETRIVKKLKKKSTLSKQFHNPKENMYFRGFVIS